MDKNYLSRIRLRRELMAKYPEVIFGATEAAKATIDEFYVWMFGTYLPVRFPRMFRLEGDDRVLNLVTNESIELNPPSSSIEAMRIIGSHIDEDILFLLPDSDGDGYSLQGVVVCFPSGFSSATKLNMKLRDIHKPVPGYKQRLEKSMDRVFQRLEPGRYIKRANASRKIEAN
jgi:hypothetical protein